jgi:thiosulfate/3-mercaptopyruvate sulfurtransferase
MRTILLLLGLTLTGWAMEPLVSTQWLFEHQKDKKLVVVDVSDEEKYRADGHIEGAVHTTIVPWRHTKGTFMQVSPKNEVETLMRRLGIDNDSQVVIYAHIHTPKDFLKASYLFWVFAYHGLQDVALLDGGFDKWVDEKRKVVQAETAPKQGSFNANINPRMLIRMSEVKEKIEKVPMFDARSPIFYFGMMPSNSVKRAGHISGAHSYFWQYSLKRDYTFLPKEQLAAVFKEGFGLKPDQEIIAYCTGGLEASLNYFTLYAFLGYEKTRLYDESMKEWGNLDETPMTRYRWE